MQSELWRQATHMFEDVSQSSPEAQSEVARHWTQEFDEVSHTPLGAEQSEFWRHVTHAPDDVSHTVR